MVKGILKRTGRLFEAECIQILSLFVYQALCGAPALLRGEAPLAGRQIVALLKTATAGTSSVLADAVRSGLLFFQAILAPAVARRRLLETVQRWRMGGAVAELRRFLGDLDWNGITGEQTRELLERIGQCQAALERMRCREADSTTLRRRGRVFRALERLFLPLKAWSELPDLAQVFLHEGCPVDASRLREKLDSLGPASLAREQRRLLSQLDEDLSHLGAPAPTLGELRGALDLLGESLKAVRGGAKLASLVKDAQARIHVAGSISGGEECAAWRDRLDAALELVRRQTLAAMKRAPVLGAAARACLDVVERSLHHRRRMSRVRENLARLLDGPPPRISTAERRRRLAQLDRIARRWFRAGLRITIARLRSEAPSLPAEDAERVRAVLQSLESLLAEGQAMDRMGEVGRLAEQLAAWPAPAPAGETLSFFLEACQQIRAAAPADLAQREQAGEPLALAAAALLRQGEWINSLCEFVQHRLQTFDAVDRARLREFLRERRFTVAPPDVKDLDRFTAWLAALSASQRESVLEFLHLGPVRPEVIEAALAVAAVEAAARREPRLSPEQLARCAAAAEACDRELGEILARELIDPLLCGRERREFDRWLKTLRRRYEGLALSPEARRRLGLRFDRGKEADAGPTPFFAPPWIGGDRLECARRQGALELIHSLWKTDRMQSDEYLAILNEHWRRIKSRANRWDADRRRPSIVEQMQLHAEETYAAAAEAGDPPPSPAALVWAVWSYLKAAEEIATRWREYVPTGHRWRARCAAPQRIEAEDPREMIEHVTRRMMQFFDLEEIVARARRDFLLITNDELHAVRTVDGLLFELFGDEGMLFPASVYARPLAQTVMQVEAALRPLAAHDGDAHHAGAMLARLAPFYRNYQPWAEAISFAPWADGAGDAIARWRRLLADLQTTARGMARVKTLAGVLAPAWKDVSDLLENQQVKLRLQLAMRVAVKRDDPSCRHLCASRQLLAQMDVERVGLAKRRRLHPRSEAAIVAAKLHGRRQTLLDVDPSQDHFRSLAEALADDCGRLLALHQARKLPRQARAAALACGRQIERRWQELRSTVYAASAGQVAESDARLVEAGRAVRATAWDVVDGFYTPTRHKGLRTLIPLRWGEALDDLLATA